MLNESSDMLSSSTEDGQPSYENSGSVTNSLIEHGSPSSSKNKSSTISSLSSENAKLKSKNKELRSRIQLMETKHKQNSDSLESELSSTRLEDQETRNTLISAVKGLESKLNEQMKINKNLSKVNKQLQIQISTFLSHVGSKSNRELRNLNDASSLYSELSNEAESYSERINDLEKQYSSLSSQLEDTSDAMKIKANESAKLKKKLKKLKQSSASSADPEEIANEVQNMKKSHNHQIHEYQNIIEQQKQQIAKLQSQLEKAQKQGKRTNEETASVSSGKEEIYKANLALLNDRVQSAEQTAADVQKQIHTLQEENQSLADRGNLLNDNLEEAKDKLVEKDKVIGDLKQKVKQAKQIIQSAKDELKGKDTEIAELDTSVHELQLRVNELENEKSQARLNKQKSTSAEPTKQYKEKIEMLESRIASFEELFEGQSQEIEKLVVQRKQAISSLSQVDQFLDSLSQEMKKVTKENKELKEQNRQIKEETQSYIEKEDEKFHQVYEDSLEVVSPALKEQLKELEGQPHSELLYNYLNILFSEMKNIEKNSQVAKDKSIANAIRNRYIALLGHLENAHKFLRQVANSQASTSDEITREEFLTACARLGKYIDEQKVEFPLDEFKPSIFEPHDIDDPQKVADVFLDFVKHDELESSPIAELFTLFMCVTQVNQILVNNIDANSAAIKQSARIAQLDDEHVQQIRELEAWKNDQAVENEKLVPILRRLLDEPAPEDYDSIVEQIISTVKEEDITSVSTNKALRSNINELMEQVDKLQADIVKSNNKNESSRVQFCKKAETIVTDVTKQVENQQKKFDEEMAKMRKEVEAANAQNANAQNGYEALLQKQKKKLAKREDLINTLRSENESLTQRSAEFQQQLGQHQSHAEEGNDTISSLKQQLKQAKEDLEKVTAHKQHYKQRLAEADAANNSTLSELKQRSEQLNSKYAQTVKDLQKQLQETSGELAKANEQVGAFSERKREYQEQIAKLQMAKRTAELKLKAADEALGRERANADAKQNTYALALKSKSDKAIECLQNNIEKCKQTLVRVLKEEFGIEEELPANDNSNNDSNNKNTTKKEEANKQKDGDKKRNDCNGQICDLIEKVNEQLSMRKEDQFAINDALKLRRVMKVDKNRSLFDEFDHLMSNLESEKQRANHAEKVAASVSTESEMVKRDSKKLERSASELNEWTVWSRSMLRQISETASPNPPSAEVRFRLEEALLASIGQRILRRKMEILRTEKKLFTTQKPASLLKSSSSKKEKITSIRPMMLSLIFAGRIQQLSGTLPAKYNGMPKSLSPPSNSDNQRRNQKPLVPFESQ